MIVDEGVNGPGGPPRAVTEDASETGLVAPSSVLLGLVGITLRPRHEV